MDSKIGAAAVLLTSIIVGFGGGSVMTHAARAADAAAPNASCGSPSACLVESNTSSGPGIMSSSHRGNGLIATTKALGSTSTNGASALFGQDLQAITGDGLFNFGVNGTSKNGTGVQGSGGTVGVSGIATSATAIGVEAATTDVNGLLFEGSGKGLGNGLPVFTLNAYGHAVFGVATPGYESGSITVNQYCGSGTPMFEGNSQNGLVFQISDCGDVIEPGNVFVGTRLYANTVQSYGQALVTVNDSLLANSGFYSSSSFDTNYTATDAAGVTWLYQGYSTTAGKFTVEMGDSGSVYARIFITMNAPRVAQKTSTGARVDTYTPQIAQPSLEDFGEAQLTDGAASVALDPRFAAAMDAKMRYYVTLTPEGDCRGLYVARRDSTGFTVRELQGGQSSIAFTYRIVAKPLGDDSARLPMSTLPYGFDHKVPPPHVHPAPHRAPRVPRP